jgi:signal peptidase I
MHPGEATTRTVLPLATQQSAAPAADTMLPPGRQPLLRLRWAIAMVMAGLVALAAVRLSFVDGLWRRAMIDGPSMAPALLGRHYDVTCGDCQFAFACDAGHLPPDGRAVCPNCGYAQNELAAAALRPADRVLIDRWRLTWRAAQRGEIVAARLPAQTEEFVVKRVASLPGEELSIQGGDLYAGGRLIRKTPIELRALRVLVHDNDYQPQRTAGLPPRWRGAAGTKWRAAATGFEISPGQPAAAELDWLEYQHWDCTGNPLVGRASPAPIRDLDPFNQGESRRALNPVPDVLLTCRIEASGEGQLVLAAALGDLRLEVIIEPGRRLIVRSGGVVQEDRTLAAGSFGRATDVQFGLCDQQLLLVAEGQVLVRWPYERKATAASTLSPLAIGARGLGLKVTQLKVWRDIYYLEPRGTGGGWQAAQPLGPLQMGLLGDNPPVSIDSRHWPDPGVARQSILGHVYRPFWVD